MKEEFRVFGRPETAQPFAVEMTGISYCDGSYRIDRPHSPVTVMEYVIRGRGVIQTRGKTFTAGAGDVYVLHRGDHHFYYSDSRDPWIKLFFNVSGPLPEQLLEIYHLDGETVVPDCPAEGLFREFFRLARLEEPAEAFRRCAFQFHEIVAAVSAARAGGSPPEEALRLKRLLDSRISGSITIRELAQAIYHSPDYTIKLFKRSFGVTPYAYLLDQRIFAAQNLLRSTSLPVKEIALRTGFSDPHYFSNLFKERCGVSPAHYRQNASAPNEG